MSLTGQRIVILGGSSGIGLATAQAAAAEGASVVIASSRKARLDVALAALPAGAEGHALDLTDEPTVKAFFAGLGSLDHLVFTARRCDSALLRTPTLPPRATFSSFAIGVPIGPPNMAAASSGRGARSSSPRASPECAPIPAGRSAPASARRWKV